MKIALTTGLIPKAKGRSTTKKAGYQPLGVAYIAAVLENEGYKVDLYDCLPLNCSVDEIVNRILEHKPDIIGISVNSANYEGAKAMASSIKKKVNNPIVFGGPHCSFFPIRTMEECQSVDFLIYGEAEFIFPMLIKTLSGRLSYADIPQLCFRNSSGSIILNEQEQPNRDLDSLPFPSRHLFNRKQYFLDTASCITSRGCSYGKCAFCMRTGLSYEKYRRRSADNVVKELEILYRDFLYKRIVFLDDNFAQDEEWVVSFCDALIQRKFTLQWSCNARADTVTKKMIQKMSEAGCFMISYGIESGDQNLLDYVNRGVSLGQVKEAISLSREFHIKTFGFFILALPKETPEIGKKTVQFAIDLDLDFAIFTPAVPLLGTRFYDLCKQEGTILDSSYEFLDMPSSVRLIPKIKFIPKGYKNKEAVALLMRFAYRKFYLRYSFICKLSKHINNWQLLRRYLLQLRLFKRLLFFKLD